MRLPKPPLLALASLLCSALLATLAGAAGVPDVALRDAAAHEGQGAVRVEGLADGLRRFEGHWRADLHADGAALPIHGEGEPPFADGDWVEAVGRVARSGGRLTLFADGAAVATPAEGPATPSWSALAADPAAWDHRPLKLAGWIERGELRDRDGHALRLADGRWPTGAATVEGFLAYAPACLCHRLHGTATPA